MSAPLTNRQIAEGNTTASQIWNAAFALLSEKVKGFTSYRQSPIVTIQPTDLPALAVYLLRDREQPMGDPDVGEPRFIEYAHLGIAGMIAQSDVDSQLGLLASKIMATRLALYTDTSFMRRIRGFESSDTRLVFSRIGETPVAEYQMELVCSFETVWPPYVPDDYKLLHLEVQFPAGVSGEGAPKIIRQWDIPQ